MSGDEAAGTVPAAFLLHRFRSSDGYRFAYRRYAAVGKRVGCVVVLHGIQSHSGWYEYSSQQIANAGYEVFSVDRRGSGENGTARGHAEHADRLINDVAQFLRFVRRDTGLLPTLIGLSWGGKLATVIAAARPELLLNLALLYPGLRANVRPTWFQRLLIRLALRCRKSQKRVRIPLVESSLFTEETRWRKFIDGDHLALHWVSIGFLQASTALDERVNECATTVRLPTLVMLAGRDRIINNRATRELIRQFACEDRTILQYDDACHTLEFEPNRGAIFSDLVN